MLSGRLSGIPPYASLVLDGVMTRRMIRSVVLQRRWFEYLSVLLLVCIGIGLVSAALPDDANADAIESGYYDGDADDAAVAPQRMAVLVDMAFGARAEALPERAPDSFDSPVEAATAPIVQQSSLPPLRSPPSV